MAAAEKDRSARIWVRGKRLFITGLSDLTLVGTIIVSPGSIFTLFVNILLPGFSISPFDLIT